ncbi:MobA/MobL family protein [Pelagibius marinus]|uniref:MobA/MobL family protein n=1 Tax=Pelagibius marinus TaxID=2762760 RepID=UPI00187252E9|nr:MobA/MobL family protein [Pelagibius marinus]
MALYRLETRIIGRSAGKRADGARAYRSGSAVAAGAYRRGARTTSTTEEGRRVHDYSKKRGVIHTETLAPEGAPTWAANSEHLWQMVEIAEKRKDSQLARELVVTLPLNVPLHKSLPATRDWLQDEVVALGMVADIAVHAYGTALDPKKPQQAARIAELERAGVPIRPLAAGDLLRDMPPDGLHAWRLPDGKILVYQPHAHVMLTMREIGPEGFGEKERAWNTKKQLYRWRQSWEQVYNDLLATVGDRERVSAKARWKREADDPQQPGPTTALGASPKILRRQLNLDGGFHAALDGRPATQTYGDMPMTAFDWNETERDLRRRMTEIDKREQATNEREEEAALDRAALLRVLARITELTSLGVEFVAMEDGGIQARGATRHLTDADKLQIEKYASFVAPMLAAAPHLGTLPKLDEQLSKSMALVDRLQSDRGIRFFRTDKGALGFAPEDTVPPEIYKQFGGQHAAILTVLEHRRYAALWREAQQSAEEEKQKRQHAEEEAEGLQRAHQAERRNLEVLEEGVTAIIESVQKGQPLPKVQDGNPLLNRLKRTFIAVVERVVQERKRADKWQRRFDLLKKGFRSFIDDLIKRRPDDKAFLEEARDKILKEVESDEPASSPANVASTDRFKRKSAASDTERPWLPSGAKMKAPDGQRPTPPTKSSSIPRSPRGVEIGKSRKGRGDVERD